MTALQETERETGADHRARLYRKAAAAMAGAGRQPPANSPLAEQLGGEPMVSPALSVEAVAALPDWLERLCDCEQRDETWREVGTVVVICALQRTLSGAAWRRIGDVIGETAIDTAERLLNALPRDEQIRVLDIVDRLALTPGDDASLADAPIDAGWLRALGAALTKAGLPPAAQRILLAASPRDGAQEDTIALDRISDEDISWLVPVVMPIADALSAATDEISLHEQPEALAS